MRCRQLGEYLFSIRRRPPAIKIPTLIHFKHIHINKFNTLNGVNTKHQPVVLLRIYKMRKFSSIILLIAAACVKIVNGN